MKSRFAGWNLQAFCHADGGMVRQRGVPPRCRAAVHAEVRCNTEAGLAVVGGNRQAQRAVRPNTLCANG